MSEKLESKRARKRLRMTKFPTRTVAMKYGIQAFPETKIQSHMDSIHSPHRTRKTIIKLKKFNFSLIVTKLSNNKPMHEVCKIPSRHGTPIPKTDITLVVFPKKLHAHHSKDENDDAKDECKVGQGPYSVHHNGQNIVKRLP